jgi:hypothetical protein
MMSAFFQLPVRLLGGLKAKVVPMLAFMMIKVLSFHTVHSKRLPSWGSIYTKLTFGVHASASPTNADDSVGPSIK